jgi:hypothetical protein
MAQARVAGKQAARRGSKRRRGRSLVAALLIGFVVVASAVISRRSYGITEARKLEELDRKLVQLEAERTRLSGLIRDESSRSRLGPTVERLGMHVPDDRQVRLIHR